MKAKRVKSSLIKICWMVCGVRAHLLKESTDKLAQFVFQKKFHIVECNVETLVA